MTVIICTVLWLTASFFMCVFSFWTGRCARKLPIIDDHLPWTISREQAPRCISHCQMQPTEPTGQPRWPYRQ
jgi:hypothetical protein